MKKITILASLLIAVGISSQAQQLHFMSQYLQHNSMINPAAAGMGDKNFIGISHRNQWNSFPGSPTTTMVYGDFKLTDLKAGIAGYLYQDKTGPTSRAGAQLAYSYQITAKNNKQKLGLGLELRGLQYTIDKGKLLSSLGPNDPALAGATAKFGIDAGAGVYYKDDRLALGIAVSQLIQSKLQLSDVPNATTSGRLYRHYNITGNYKIDGGDGISVIPNALFRMVQNAPTEFQAGCKVDYQDLLWVNILGTYRQSYSLQFGFCVAKKLRVSYAYDGYTDALSSNFQNGAAGHEIGLRFDLTRKNQN
jgi:type IX secretion system PorP/SprF family membrane protein